MNWFSVSAMRFALSSLDRAEASPRSVAVRNVEVAYTPRTKVARTATRKPPMIFSRRVSLIGGSWGREGAQPVDRHFRAPAAGSRDGVGRHVRHGKANLRRDRSVVDNGPNGPARFGLPGGTTLRRARTGPRGGAPTGAGVSAGCRTGSADGLSGLIGLEHHDHGAQVVGHLGQLLGVAGRVGHDDGRTRRPPRHAVGHDLVTGQSGQAVGIFL